MDNINIYKLKANPFRTVPATNEEEIIWAGFGEIKEKFEKRIRRIIKLPNSSILLNWGEYGSGKTHAARYFSCRNVLREICQLADGICPLSIVINFPGKYAVKEIFVSIIDKIDFHSIHSALLEKGVIKAASSVTDSIFAQSVVDYISDKSFDADLYKKYLYGSLTSKEKGDLPFLRSINTDNDIIEILSALLSYLTENGVYPAIIIWIDEFEHIAYQSSSSINSINNFIKVLLDKTPNRLLLIINFTLSAMANYEDLSAYLQDAVKSRIKERIEFAIPNQAQLLDYLSELLDFYRIDSPEPSFFPFDINVICQLIKDLGDVSLRRFNDAMSLLLENALCDEQASITLEYYESIKSEIIGWQGA